MANPKIKVTMTFTTELELTPDLYPNCKNIEEMMAEEKKFFSNYRLIIHEYLPGEDDLQYNFTIEEVKWYSLFYPKRILDILILSTRRKT